MAVSRLPSWLKVQLPAGKTYSQVTRLLQENRLQTVCQNALCPNRGECYGKGTATFLILGKNCTRHCRYCHIGSDPPVPPDPGEAEGIARVCKELSLKFVVITSVTRDDLPDGGAAHFADVCRTVQEAIPGIKLELLIPDFRGNPGAIRTVLEAGPHILAHNLETVSRLFPLLRPEGDYQRSLELLHRVKQNNPGLPLKSGLMLGCGENTGEIEKAFHDLRSRGVDILTLGQYLQPSAAHHPVSRFYSPQEFTLLAAKARETGFHSVLAGPLVRSSYHAGELYHEYTSDTL